VLGQREVERIVRDQPDVVAAAVEQQSVSVLAQSHVAETAGRDCVHGILEAGESGEPQRLRIKNAIADGRHETLRDIECQQNPLDDHARLTHGQNDVTVGRGRQDVHAVGSAGQNQSPFSPLAISSGSGAP
jgi:hypothetical protein